MYKFEFFSSFIDMVIGFVKYFFIFAITQYHAFYVSVCEIYHNPKSLSLEISIKIFIDDLELAIQKSGVTNFRIIENEDQNKIEREIALYLDKKLIIEINDEKTQRKMIGYELENDALICYIEIEKIKKMSKVKVHNSIITEVYEDQINLTHLQYKGQLKSLKTTKEEPDGLIDTSSW